MKPDIFYLEVQVRGLDSDGNIELESKVHRAEPGATMTHCFRLLDVNAPTIMHALEAGQKPSPQAASCDTCRVRSPWSLLP